MCRGILIVYEFLSTYLSQRIGLQLQSLNQYLMSFDKEKAFEYISNIFWGSYIPSLSEFVAIPNTSRLYDPEWNTNGLLEQAAHHVEKWIHELGIKGLKTQLLKEKQLSPLLLIEVEGDIKDHTILYYGHFDKQPHMGGWDQDKGPTKPVQANNRLYGRGSGDDGYSAYSSMLAVKAVQDQGIPLPNIIMIFEGDEESGNHIESYFPLIRDRLGKIDIVFCFDSGCYDLGRVWITKSIRGYIDFEVHIKTLTEGVHSGDSSGIVPSTFRIANLLLNRLQNFQTGRVDPFFSVDIPAQRYSQIYNISQLMGKDHILLEPHVEGLKLVEQNTLDLYLNSTWRPQVTVIGLTDLPAVEKAGNVMLPETKFKINMRVPPTCDRKDAQEYLEGLITKNPPFDASISVKNYEMARGWSCKPYESWLQTAIDESSVSSFNSPAYCLSEGGSVPIIAMLGTEYEAAQIIVTGVLGPGSNAHGPNESIDMPYTLKFTQSMSQLLAKCSIHYSSAKTE